MPEKGRQRNAGNSGKIFQIALTILIAFVCVWYFGQRVSVVGDSMKPVLENGDIVLANRIVYNASKPKRGDVIIFKPKGNENSYYYIKRIIALPGESVEIIENSVYINGEKLQEDYETSKIDDVGIVNEKNILFLVTTGRTVKTAVMPMYEM